MAKNVIKINKKILLDELDLPNYAIHDEVVDKSRWSEHHWIVFEYEGRFWGCSYSVGRSESQDEYAWDYEDEVECEEVEKVTKTVTVETWEVKK